MIGAAVFLLSIKRLVRDSALTSLPQNGVWIVFVILAWSYLALSSSVNQGVGFTHPILPLLIAMCMVVISEIRWRPLRFTLVAAFVLVSAFNVVMKADVDKALSGTRFVQVPGLGTLVAMEGRGDVQRALSFDGNDVGPPTSPMPDRQKQWLVIGREITKWTRDFAVKHQQQPVIVFGSANPFFHTSLLRLAAWLHLGMSLDVGQIDAGVSGDSVAAYRAQLIEKRPNFLITTDRSPWEFPPFANQVFIEDAAHSLGFTQVASYRLPDGLETRIWWLDRK